MGTVPQHPLNLFYEVLDTDDSRGTLTRYLESLINHYLTVIL